MSKDAEVVVASASGTEQAVREIFRRHVEKLSKVLLTRKCHRTIEQNIRGMAFLLWFVQREARRKKRSKEYAQVCAKLLGDAATAELGSLANLTATELTAFEQMLDAIVDGIAGGNPIPGSINPEAFVGVQKRIFVQPKRRGRRRSVDYDAAYLRHLQGEEVSSIARELDPYGFQRDPEQSMQNLRKAFLRRRRF